MLLIALAALLLEAVFGYSKRLLRTIGHPVMWIGALIAGFERRFNNRQRPREQRHRLGIITVAVVVGSAAVVGLLLQVFAFAWLPWWLADPVLALLATPLLAQRSLRDHVFAVRDALAAGDLVEARAAVGQIVGRDTAELDETGVTRAAVETLAESFADGVVAPAFWLALLGLGGAAAYKAANTADSMIGHKTARFRTFGWAAARFDDGVNWLPARLAGALLVGAAFACRGVSGRAAWRVMRADALRHASPNAGWPEAAMAGALGVALGGPRSYDGEVFRAAALGAGGRQDLALADLDRALRLFAVADGLLIGLVALITAILWVGPS